MSKSDNKTMSRSERKKQKKNKKPNKGGLWKKILLGMLGVILAVLVAGSALFAYYASDAPELTEEDLTGTYASELVDMNGEVFYKTGGQEREFAAADEYPEVMRDAMKAIEDQRFNSHLGVDPIGIGRAALGLVMNQEIVGGGSTITQQLIKNSVFSTLEEDQTLERKAQEAWLAIQLEQQLSKEQIMTLYLNKIHMGSNVYGVATAAEEYYGKHVSELELHEAAMFAGMPRAPNYYNPYRNEEAAKNRRDTVLQSMVDFGSITQEEADAAMQVPITEGLQEQTEDPNALVYDGYITQVREEIENKTNFNVDTAGLTVYTNYDPNAQQVMYDVVNSDEYVNYPNEELQTAATLVDSRTGKISAIIGGRNLEGQLSDNRAINLRRDIGSTIKSLTTYAPAIGFLQYSTYHQVYDEPYELNGWEPGNYDNDFEGQMSMREALVDSRNVPTAKLFNEDLGDYREETRNFLESMGIDVSELNAQEEGFVASNAISGAMSPMDLTGAYTTFANNGTYIEPHAVTRVVSQDGQEIDLTPESAKAMEESTAYMVNDMLKDVVSYYGEDLNIPGYIHAAKTGTSNYTADEMTELNIPSDGVPDNWVVGYSPYYTMSVWVGYDQARQEGNYLTFEDGSRSLARDVYREAISRLTEDFEQRDWQQPDSVVELSIEDGTDPAQLAAPGSSNTVSELFVRENQPNTRAEPEELDLSAPSGLSANYDANSDTISVNWDAYEINEKIYGDVQYVLNMNGQEQVVSGTSYQFDSPPTGDVSISLAVRADGNTGPSSSVQVTVPDPSEDEDTEDEENDGEEEEPPEDSDPENEEDNDSEDEDPPQDSENEEDNDSDSDAENENDNENNDNPSEDDSSDNGSNDDSSGESNNDDNNNNNADGESDPPPNDE